MDENGRPIPRKEALSQTPEERKLNQMLDLMFVEARAARERLEPQWDENLDYLRGDQPARHRPQGFASVVTNQIWRIVQQSAALLTDARPFVEVTSRPNDEHWTRINTQLKKLIEAQWFLNDVDRLLVRVIYDLFTTGSGYIKCYWDPFREWNLGDIAIARINPRNLYIDPHASTLEQAEYICYRIPVSLWEVRRRFDPERASRVVPDASLSTFTEASQRHRLPLPTPRRKLITRESAIPKVWLEEWWVRDPGQTEAFEPKYPAGRLITRAGNVILLDMPNPYWDPWPGPWVEFVINRFDEGPYGEPDISQLKIIQDAVNALTSLLVDNVRFMTNGIWVLDEDALSPEERKKLPSARPATVIVKRPGRELRREVGQAIPGQIIELLNVLKMDQQFISGLMDSGYGRPPRGITAGAAIELLQLATQATIRLKAREIEAGLLRLGQLIVSRVFQYYTTQKRVVDYLGPSGIEPIVWDPEELAPLVGLEEVPMVTEEDRKWLLKQFRVRITPASSLALSKEKQWATELALYSAGLVDRRAVLERLDYPNKEEVLRRMETAEMIQAQMQTASRASRDGRQRTRSARRIISGLMR